MGGGDLTEYYIGNLRTGRRLDKLTPLAGSGPWSEVLNKGGSVSCTVSLRDEVMQKLNLFERAQVGRSFLAAFDADTGLQGGPIWAHNWDPSSGKLQLIAGGMWTYFDHRVLLPVLAGRVPSDPTTDTRFMPADLDPDSIYPWPTDTRKSYQGMVRALVAQAQAETGGDVPVILPSEIAGSKQRDYRGSDVAPVGDRLAELTALQGGPDIRFSMRFTADRQGVEWPLLIGTPSQPLLASSQRHVFNIGVKDSSITNFLVNVNGSQIGSRAFSVGGAAAEKALSAVSVDPTLTDAGWPVLDLVDEQRSTVSNVDTLQAYADELTLRGRRPILGMSFTHDLQTQPYLSSINVGDFADARVKKDLYLPDGSYPLRMTERSGNVEGKKVDLKFVSEVL